MARSIAEINNTIVTNLVTQFATVNITIDPTTWSKRNILRNICYSFAIAQNIAEQLQDLSIAQMLDIQSKTIAGTKKWLQYKMFQFQYSATNPQVLQVINNVPTYATIDANLRIITACSVRSTLFQAVLIKVAKGNPLTALTTAELTEAQSYINALGVAGITYNVQSANSDKMYIEGTIYYNGTYSSVIFNNVLGGIRNYLYTLSQTDFDGYLYVTNLINFIKSIKGVNDIVIDNLSCRLDSQAIGGGLDLIVNGDIVNRRYLTGAGYIADEPTFGYRIIDKITYIAE
jgi:hypothetical protein